MNVSILFATYKRNDLLALMLESFTRLNTHGIAYEIIAVDNCPQQTAKPLVAEFAERLPIHYCAEPLPGKNAALTAGLKIVTGNLIIFTDDDIEADPGWVYSLVNAAERNPQHSIFGGRILPKYPPNREQLGKGIDFTNDFVKIAYSEADWSEEEGPIDAGNIWGANMMVRREVFSAGLSFNIEVGPKGTDYAMGSETEFLVRAYAAGFRGIYVPGALVRHHILPNQLSVGWIAGRAYRMARGGVQINPKLHYQLWWGVPRFLYKNLMLKKIQIWLGFLYNDKEHFANIIGVNIIRGQIAQYRVLARQKTTSSSK